VQPPTVQATVIQDRAVRHPTVNYSVKKRCVREGLELTSTAATTAGVQTEEHLLLCFTAYPGSTRRGETCFPSGCRKEK